MHVTLLITIRSDFSFHCTPFPLLRADSHDYRHQHSSPTTVDRGLLTRIDQITVLRLQSLPGLLLGAAGLGDDQLDVVVVDFGVAGGSRGLGLVGFVGDLEWWGAKAGWCI